MFSLVPWKKRNNGNIKVRQDDRFAEHPLMQIRDEFESLVDRFFGESPFGRWPSLDLFESPRWGWNMNLEDQGDHYVLVAEAPGFEPEDFEVKVRGNSLVIRAESKEESKGKHESGYQYEQFFQTMTIPNGVNVDAIDARYHSGVLEVKLPKSDSVRPKRIEVKSA